MSPAPAVFRLGTRKSALAMTQSQWVRERLLALGVRCELVLIESEGDQDRKTPLYEIETEAPGLFTKQLEKALLSDTIDLAVHSLKDLPIIPPPGLTVAAVPERVSSEDCLIHLPTSAEPTQKFGLKHGAKLGTSSLRREAQWRSERPDIVTAPIRGNVQTRIQKVFDGEFDAVVLARAGIFRLGLDLKEFQVSTLPLDTFVSAPGQGALAVEIREDAPTILREAVTQLNNPIAAQETRIERAILKGLHGGCTLPLGVRVWGDKPGNGLKLKAFLGICTLEPGGLRRWEAFRRFDFSDAREETLVAKTLTFFKDAARDR